MGVIIMDWTENLISKTLDKTAVVGIVGLGYVGLPLAVAFWRIFMLLVIISIPRKVELLKQKKIFY